MKLLKRVLYVASFLGLLSASIAGAQPAAGRDYTLINPPQPTESGKNVEVVEFFYYGCIHCYHLEGPLKAWLKRKPADVVFRYVPAVFDPSWLPLTRTFYALEAMGLTEKVHEDLFTAIHKERVRGLGNDPRVIADWLATKGVDKQKFLDTYNSFAVNGRAQRAADLTRSHDVPGTPALVIDGKYLTGPSMTVNPDNTVNYTRFFQVVDQLIAQARKERAGK
jgi:protein dithiol oxidoreductase (disulfide-forming)